MLDRIAAVEVCPDGAAAMHSYRRLHQQYPTREFYFVHTARENLDIKERWWMGIRRNDAAYVCTEMTGNEQATEDLRQSATSAHLTGREAHPLCLCGEKSIS